ncbi:amidohydrolase family protein [Novosphingobium sp. G106]|uniref:amidohydrolase family protein n=1 Tax=Novosphingobium sp. G106 TaxID=2849500 RepID=UPI001C2DA8C7|nr:amidohydrolase family protein [Novosphingobium sp. G106]MBV1690657.1 amidohydrolase family protein [Novosphingobium sp. G106]
MARLVVQNASLLDGDTAARRATIVVEGERITAVTAGPIDAHPDDRLIELAGKTIMPGMILGHYHAGYWRTGSTGKPIGFEASPALQAIRAAHNLKTALDCGFTGVISAGTPHGIDPALKVAIAEGTIQGPRMIAGSRDVGSTGFSADLSFPAWWQLGARGGVNTANGADDFRRAVREEIKDGAEIVKLFATGGHATGGTGAIREITDAEFAAAVEVARDRGCKVRAHIASAEATLLAVKLGVHIVDHGDGLNDLCLEKLVESGTFLTPSLLFPKEVMKIMAGQPFAEAMRADWDAMAAILPKANAAGVKLLIGDDYGAFSLTHGRYAEELALYVNEIGIPALDVIRWATKHGAEAMGTEAGVIAPGKLADLVVVDGDPAADITVLQDPAKILAVFKGGDAVKDNLG